MSISIKTPQEVQAELARRFKARRLALDLTQEGLADPPLRRELEFPQALGGRTGLIARLAAETSPLVLDLLLGILTGSAPSMDRARRWRSRSRPASGGKSNTPERPNQMTYPPTELLTGVSSGHRHPPQARPPGGEEPPNPLF